MSNNCTLEYAKRRVNHINSVTIYNFFFNPRRLCCWRQSSAVFNCAVLHQLLILSRRSFFDLHYIVHRSISQWEKKSLFHLALFGLKISLVSHSLTTNTIYRRRCVIVRVRRRNKILHLHGPLKHFSYPYVCNCVSIL